ncbi:MAG: hypothetical protein ACOYKE_07465 [Ferruginibacter sp.]
MSALNGISQSLDSIKSYKEQRKMIPAVYGINEYLSQFPQNVEAWLLKAEIYDLLNADARYSDLVVDSRMDALNSLQEAKRIDAHFTDSVLSSYKYSILFNIYNGYISDGIAIYNSVVIQGAAQDRYLTALQKFTNAERVGKMLQFYHQIPILDTNLTFFIAKSAIQAKKEAIALNMSQLITKAKIKSTSIGGTTVSIYEWLAFYYRSHGLMAQLEDLSNLSVQLFTEQEHTYFYLNLIDAYRKASNWDKLLLTYSKAMHYASFKINYESVYLKELYQLVYFTKDFKSTISLRKKLKSDLENFLKKSTNSNQLQASSIVLAKVYINESKLVPAMKKQYLGKGKYLLESLIQSKNLNPESDRVQIQSLLYAISVSLNDEAGIKLYQQNKLK